MTAARSDDDKTAPAEAVKPAKAKAADPIPVRSEFAQAAAGFAAEVARTADDLGEALTAHLAAYTDLMQFLPGADDAMAHHHSRRVVGVIGSLAREVAQVRAVAAELTAAAV